MKPLLMSLTLCALALGALSVRVEAIEVVDATADVLTVPEALQKELQHPKTVRECFASLKRRVPPLIIDTSDLTLEAARINTHLHLILPLKAPQQGIERVYWPADSLVDVQTVLTMLREDKLQGVRVIPFDAFAVPTFYWVYADRDAKTKEALKKCQAERIIELLRCRSCVISELVGVRP